jgi:CelD/BcsL family acetyltransferase involved in cellulose biosynthesis
MTDLTASTVRGLDGLRRLGPELDDLHARVGAPVSTRTLWLMTWAETHPAYEPICVVVRSAERVEAAAVLAKRRVLGCDLVVGAGHTLSDRIWLPARDDASARALVEAVAAFLETLTRPWFLDLRQLPVDDPVATQLLALVPSGELRDGMPLVQTRFTRGRRTEDYTNKRHQRGIRQAQRQLSSDHEWSFTWIRDPVEIQRILPEIEVLRRARDESLRRIGELDRGGGGEFWRRLVPASAGTVEVVTLVVDGRLAGYCVCLRDGDALRAWDSRAASAYLEYWPGNLILAEVLRASFADPGIQWVDWLRGESEYKQRLATGVERAQDLRAWSSPAARRTYELLERTRAELAALKNRSDRLARRWLALRRRADPASGVRRVVSAPGEVLHDATPRVPQRRGAPGDVPGGPVPGQELEPEDAE